MNSKNQRNQRKLREGHLRIDIVELRGSREDRFVFFPLLEQLAVSVIRIDLLILQDGFSRAVQQRCAARTLPD